MASHRAIAAVTEVLRRRLNASIHAELPDAQVVADRPQERHDRGESVVSVFLYGVTPSADMRRNDLPAHGPGGRPQRVPSIALDLHYLLSFTGDERNLVAQRMLGLALASLHAEPMLSDAELSAAAADGVTEALELTEARERVRLAIAPTTSDELSQLWSMLGPVPYQLSVFCTAGVVFIDSG